MPAALLLAQDAAQLHRSRYGGSPQTAVAPGRVNIIGEHTDYNDGFVLPMAIDRCCAVAFTARDDGLVRGYSREFSEEVTFSLSDARERGAPGWSAYFKGIAFALLDRGIALRGCDLTIASDVPIGAGLSSSASFEMATGLALLANAGRTLAPADLAVAGQWCEHRYVGIRSGIMDQLTATAATPGNALLIDCRSLHVTPVAMPADWCVAVCDTLVRHTLASSQYNQRRADCERAVEMLAAKFPGVRALRDVDASMLESVRTVMEPRVYRRALHVIEENARTVSAADALRACDGAALGALMRASHASLRDLYEVSIPELDELADICGQTAGVYGARMTGGGFGGSVVAVLNREAVQSLRDRVEAEYYAPRDEPAAIAFVNPSAGASLVSYP